jgi:hypothetical protein
MAPVIASRSTPGESISSPFRHCEPVPLRRSNRLNEEIASAAFGLLAMTDQEQAS